MTRRLRLSVQNIFRNLNKIRAVVIHPSERFLDPIDQRIERARPLQEKEQRKKVIHLLRVSEVRQGRQPHLPSHLSSTAARRNASSASSGRPICFNVRPQSESNFGSGNRASFTALR